MKKFSLIIGAVVLVCLAGGASWLTLSKLYPENNSPAVTPEIIVPEPSFAEKQLLQMTLRQKVASLLILHTPGTDVATLQTYLQTYQPGGLIFMGDNLPTATEDLTAITSQLQTNPELPYLFAIDEEGGVVERLSSDTFPAAATLKTQPASEVEAAFIQRSTLLKQVGMNLNFGIVADVTDDSASFIYQRVFGGEPTIVGRKIAAAVTGSTGFTLSTLKHFPGHGETISDSHTSVPITDVSLEKWQLSDEPPFEQGVKAGAEAVMFGHLIYSSVDPLPASLSTKWHQILSDQIGFEGISITDDMVMLQQSGDTNYADPIANAISALQAGNTMLLFVLDHGGGASDIDPNSLINGIVTAVENGSISQTVIDANTKQVLTLRNSLPTILNR